MSTEPETPENPEPVAAEAQPVAPAPAPQQAQPSFDPRRRLRELLSIPERDRTDSQWDEINELEIQLAPGNRVSPGHPAGSSDKLVGSGGGSGGGSGSGRQFPPKKHPPKSGGKRRPRPGSNPNNPNKPQQQ
jgi:hypothetical protein